MITYRATLDVPMELLRFVTRLLILADDPGYLMAVLLRAGHRFRRAAVAGPAADDAG